MKKSIFSSGGKACGGGSDIEDLILRTCDLDPESDIEDLKANPRGWTAKPRKWQGRFVLVNMLNETYSGKSVEVIGALEGDRLPVRIEEGIEVRIRPKNLALPNSDAARCPRTAEEAKLHQEQVDSDSGRISTEDLKKINSSPACGCRSCAGACWIQPGIYTPRQILDMIERGVLDPSNIVLDFYSTLERPGPGVGILRPRKVEELGLSLSAFTPIPGIPCINLGPKGCVLSRDEMPTNCKALHCDKSVHVSMDKHTSAYKHWDNPEGRQVVAWFQRLIRARDPTAPITEEYFMRQTFMAAMNPNQGFAHQLGCAHTINMIELATQRMNAMISSPDPEIIDIIKRQIETRLKYVSDMERSLLSLLLKSLTAIEVFMARK
jgi:hypothetical protein